MTLARFRRLSREGLWVVIGHITAILGAIVGVRVLTELLDPTQYGELALGLTVATLLNHVIFGPIAQGASRYYAPAAESGELAEYASVVRRLLLQSTALVVVLFLLVFGVFWAIGKESWLPIIVVAFVVGMLGGYNALLIGVQNAARQRSIVAVHQGAASWLRFLMAGALIVALGASSTIALYGYALATMLILVSQVYFARKLIRVPQQARHLSLLWRNRILGYSWPFGTWGVFCWAQSASDRWALGIFQTRDEVGLYAILFQIGYYPISVATSLVVQFVAPILFQRSGDATDLRRNAGASGLTWKLTWLALGLTAIGVVAALIFHRPIFELVVAPSYRSVSEFLPWMLLAGGVFATGQIMSLKLMSAMKTRALIPVKVVTALFGLGLNFIGGYLFGMEGIIAAMVVFSISYAGWNAMLFAKEHAREHSVLTGNHQSNV